MAPKIPLSSARTQPNSHDQTLADIRATSHAPVKVSEDFNRSEILRLIQQCKADCGMSQKELALNASCRESEMSDGLAGARRFSAEWLWLQPDRFLLRFVELLMEARHLTPENARAVRAARIKELIGLLLEEAA